jgi:HAMP domain-containing protein
MKSRLSSTIWTLVAANGVVLFSVLGLAYSAGRQSGGASILDFGALPSGASGSVLIAAALALGMALFLAWRLGAALLNPVQQLAEFSERFAAGDNRARVEVHSQDELGYIAENLNRAVAKVSKATSNQEANENLQRSITELLTVINQVARGDLSLRGGSPTTRSATWPTPSITCSTTSPRFSSACARPRWKSPHAQTTFSSPPTKCRPARPSRIKKSPTRRAPSKNSRSR